MDFWSATLFPRLRTTGNLTGFEITTSSFTEIPQWDSTQRTRLRERTLSTDLGTPRKTVKMKSGTRSEPLLGISMIICTHLHPFQEIVQGLTRPLLPVSTTHMCVLHLSLKSTTFWLRQITSQSLI